MYSHEELISAVSAAGRDGKTFTVKDVRTHLGFDSRDKKELSRFRRRLRAFEKAAADQLEKLGNNSYRLRTGAFDEAAPAAATAPAVTAAPAATVSTDAVEARSATTASEAIATPAKIAAPTPEAIKAPATEAVAARIAVVVDAQVSPEPEVQLEPASGVFSAVAANEPEAQPQPVREAPALHVVEPVAAAPEQPAAPAEDTARAAYVATPPPHEHSVSTPQRVLSVAGALVSSAFAASAAVSGKVRERGRNLREQLWSCVRSAPARKHAFARLRGWAESVRPLSNEVREQLSALRQRVLASRRRAA